MLAPEATVQLDPGEEYGVQWYNRYRVTERAVSEPDGEGGRRYRKRRTFKPRPREEWVAAPIPTSKRLPRKLVEQARAMIEGKKSPERKHLARPWELRGLMRCGCGPLMKTRTTKATNGRLYHYYTCPRLGTSKRAHGCPQKILRAAETEAAIWSFVAGVLKDPDKVRAGMDALIEKEKAAGSRDLPAEVEAWYRKLEECARLRKAYQDQQAAGLMTLQELGERLQELDDTRSFAEAELGGLEAASERVEDLERDRDALLEELAAAIPQGLDGLTGEERGKVYRMLRLKVTPAAEGFEVRGAFVLPKRHLPLGRNLLKPGVTR